MHKLFLMVLLLCASMQAQQTISGTVLNEKNEPLPGAGIFWKDTTISTASLVYRPAPMGMVCFTSWGE